MEMLNAANRTLGIKQVNEALSSGERKMRQLPITKIRRSYTITSMLPAEWATRVIGAEISM